jgi:hypothetical protein
MKTKHQQPTKEFDAVQFMREQRATLSEKLSAMTKEEIILYFQEQQSLAREKLLAGGTLIEYQVVHDKT